jgi:putative spermidine/putrescine transport system ATP-binding protein
MSVRLMIEDLAVRLGNVPVLDGVSVSVEPGEFVTLLGPSGSGKSTTLNVIAGFIKQSRGRILFNDRAVDELPAHRRDIGFVFQNYALFPHLSVRDNVEFPLRTRKRNRTERRRSVDEALALVQLHGMADRAVRSLSGGQQQRVALARALVFGPSVLLLDEPLAALDKQLREVMQVELKRIQKETGVTTLAVTHDQSEGLSMSDRVAIMEGGRIAQFGTPEELYRRPRSLFVARFLGEANLLPVDGSGFIPGLELRTGTQRRGTALLRPEDIGIQELGHHGAGTCPALVESVAYQGSRYRVATRARQNPELSLVVSAPPDADIRSLRIGDQVTLSCTDPQRIHVIDETEPESAPTGAIDADTLDAVTRVKESSR